MPDANSSSPIAPTASSRLWTAGASGGLAAAVLLGVAAVNPDQAPWLVTGAVVVAVATWLVSRPGPTPVASSLAAPGPVALTGAAVPVVGAPSLLEAAVEALIDPLLVVSGGEPDDIAGRRVVMANRAARDLLRLSREGALLVSVLRDPTVLEAVDEALFGGVARSVAWAAAGTQARHWQAQVRPLPAIDDRRLALVVLRDETDVRRMELMRVDFLANASHELRTPLASLAGFIETLKGHARDDPKARDRFLDIMGAQAERMSRLVADLLSLSRIELNEHIPPSGRLDLTRAVADVVDALSVLTHERGVRVAVSAQDGVRIRGERDEILQVVQNLMDNAVKYSPREGVVTVEVHSGLTLEKAMGTWFEGASRLPLLTPDRDEAVRYAAVVVRDAGPGLAREHLPRLTERFYRVEGQKSGDRPGTGLGLAIVKHIVNRHRGGLSVESVPGQGAVFTAFFPMAEAPPPRTGMGPAL
jgi:two-component system, OmpR family, phosphate regulon sensor histidine kinase PhoR